MEYVVRRCSSDWGGWKWITRITNNGVWRECKYCKNDTVVHYGLSIEHTTIVPESRRISPLVIWCWPIGFDNDLVPLGKWWTPFSSFLRRLVWYVLCTIIILYKNTVDWIKKGIRSATMELKVAIGIGTSKIEFSNPVFNFSESRWMSGDKTPITGSSPSPLTRLIGYATTWLVNLLEERWRIVNRYQV
jgi:hypothetical protein